MKINSKVIKEYRKFNSEIYDLRSLARKVYKEVERVNDPVVTQKILDDWNEVFYEILMELNGLEFLMFSSER